jgi:transcription elongation GreA/GreB family factor
MSRAFVKDRSDAPEPRLERPASAAPNYVTPRGFDQLKAELHRAQLAGEDREVRYFRSRIDGAIVVTPDPAADEVAFGSTVTVRDAKNRRITLRIVGEDEADALKGLVSWDSPVAKALSGRRAGDRVTVLRPAGPIVYTIESLTVESEM